MWTNLELLAPSSYGEKYLRTYRHNTSGVLGALAQTCDEVSEASVEVGRPGFSDVLFSVSFITENNHIVNTRDF